MSVRELMQILEMWRSIRDTKAPISEVGYGKLLDSW